MNLDDLVIGGIWLVKTLSNDNMLTQDEAIDVAAGIMSRHLWYRIQDIPIGLTAVFFNRKGNRCAIYVLPPRTDEVLGGYSWN